MKGQNELRSRRCPVEGPSEKGLEWPPLRIVRAYGHAVRQWKKLSWYNKNSECIPWCWGLQDVPAPMHGIYLICTISSENRISLDNAVIETTSPVAMATNRRPPTFCGASCSLTSHWSSLALGRSLELYCIKMAMATFSAEEGSAEHESRSSKTSATSDYK